MRPLAGGRNRCAMPLADKLYDWLLHGPAPACDRIAGAALLRAEAGWAERLTGLLLSRESEAAWAVLLTHYPRLSPAACGRLAARRELFAAGLAIAIKSAEAEGRIGALSALEAHPEPRLTYIAADALRDPDHRVRTLAATVLCRAANALLERQERADSFGAGDADSAAASDDGRADRAQIVRALDDALRIFHTHHRADVLQAGLWLCGDLEGRVWGLLNTRRSHAALLVSERLASWNSPRLAGFLLSALRQPAWRALAGRMLAGWNTREELIALLRASDWLDDAEVRRRVESLREPQWFAHVAVDLQDLPAELRGHAPRWLAAAALLPGRKIELLRTWARSAEAAVQRGATYALASMPEPQALEALEPLARHGLPLAAFCRWTIRARKMQLVRSRADEPAPDAAERALDVDFALLWQICRRTEATRRGELVDIVRENIHAWRWRIRNCFRSPDPRDRILALQVVSTPDLALLFRRDLQALRDDPVQGIRQLAQTLASADRPDAAELAPEPDGGEMPDRPVGRPHTTPDRPVGRPHTTPDRPVGQPHTRQAAAAARIGGEPGDEQRQQLRERLEVLAAAPAASDDAAALREVRGLLRQVYGGSETAEGRG